MAVLSQLASRQTLVRVVPIRALALLLIVTAAYHYSLLTLVRGLTLQTPLAYLAIVPVIALLLAWIRLAREPMLRPIHDRQVDYIVGFGLLGAALAILLLLPATLATRFWLYRIDLLSLPVFVAGMVSLFFGVRRLWALKVPIGFLFLAWPLPYAPLVGDWMEGFTGATERALILLSGILPFAVPAPAGEGVFFVGEGMSAFAVTVAAACAGVNSLVGFVLIGGALAYVVRGRLVRRVLWLSSGLVIIWLLNLARIELVFAVGALFGRQAAIDILHPFAGLMLFNLGVFGMLVAVRRFGLHFVELPRSIVEPDPQPVRSVRAPMIIGMGLALLVGFSNAAYAQYETIAGPLGEARLKPFDIRTAQVTGWESGFVASNEAGKQYFGPDSSWDRLLYASTDAAVLRASVPVYVDVITTPDPGSLVEFGMEACYAFHGYRIDSQAAVDLGAGVTANIVDYHNARVDADWSALWWEWPYQADGKTWYARIVIFVASGSTATYHGLPAAASPSDPQTVEPRFAKTDRFLAALAREIVRSQLHEAST